MINGPFSIAPCLITGGYGCLLVPPTLTHFPNMKGRVFGRKIWNMKALTWGIGARSVGNPDLKSWVATWNSLTEISPVVFAFSHSQIEGVPKRRLPNGILPSLLSSSKAPVESHNHTSLRRHWSMAYPWHNWFVSAQMFNPVVFGSWKLPATRKVGNCKDQPRKNNKFLKLTYCSGKVNHGAKHIAEVAWSHHHYHFLNPYHLIMTRSTPPILILFLQINTPVLFNNFKSPAPLFCFITQFQHTIR